MGIAPVKGIIPFDPKVQRKASLAECQAPEMWFVLRTFGSRTTEKRREKGDYWVSSYSGVQSEVLPRFEPTEGRQKQGPDPKEQWRDRARFPLNLWTDYVPVPHPPLSVEPDFASMPMVADSRLNPVAPQAENKPRKKENTY